MSFTQLTKEQAREKVKELVQAFKDNIEQYKLSTYKEAQVRKEFIDPLFIALGWDVSNEDKRAEQYKEVINEDAIKISGNTKAPEYILIRKDMKTKEFMGAYQDIPKLHTIRGRLLNLSTILECFMKFYLNSKGITIPKNIIDYRGKNGVFNKFLDELKKDKSISKNGLKSFERHFKVLTSKRNNFAHGIIYYKNKKKSRPCNVNNNILNPFPPKALSSKPIDDSLNKNKTVFDQLNKSYEYVIRWLKERNMLKDILKAKGFYLLEAESKINIKKI